LATFLKIREFKQGGCQISGLLQDEYYKAKRRHAKWKLLILADKTAVHDCNGLVGLGCINKGEAEYLRGIL